MSDDEVEDPSMELSLEIDDEEAREALKAINRMTQAVANKLDRIANRLENLPIDWDEVDLEKVDNIGDLDDQIDELAQEVKGEENGD